LRPLLPLLLALGLLAGCGRDQGADHAGHDHGAAGEDHAHAAPHGGKVRTTTDHKHIELLLSRSGEIHVYLLDTETRPASAKGVTGAVRLMIGSEVKKVPLSYDEKSDSLTAKTDAFTVDQVIAVVEVEGAGKLYSARFEYPLPKAP
jgi:hypothetical protein